MAACLSIGGRLPVVSRLARKSQMLKPDLDDG
jgi:hypothetical protein